MDTDVNPPVPQALKTVRNDTSLALAAAGDWLYGRQRVAAWSEVRRAATDPLDRARRAAVSPFAVEGDHSATEDLPAAAVEVVHRLASDPGRLSRAWAQKAVADLGEEVYTELVAVASIATVVDRFDLVMGDPLRSLPDPVDGEPARVRPDGMGDVGAWVSQSLDKQRANVSRAVSLVPETEAVWRSVVDSHYSRGGDFVNLNWERALSRPQVELVAARTTALNECFY